MSLAPHSPWLFSINARGDIVGDYSAGGTDHGFLAQNKPASEAISTDILQSCLLRKCARFRNMLWTDAGKSTRPIFMLRGEPRS